MPDIGPNLPPNTAAGQTDNPSNPSIAAQQKTETSTVQAGQQQIANALGDPASSSGDGIVWASTTWKIGPFSTGITTRGLKDAAVLTGSVILIIIGFAMISKPDLSRLKGVVPIPV